MEEIEKIENDIFKLKNEQKWVHQQILKKQFKLATLKYGNTKGLDEKEKLFAAQEIMIDGLNKDNISITLSEEEWYDVQAFLEDRCYDGKCDSVKKSCSVDCDLYNIIESIKLMIGHSDIEDSFIFKCIKENDKGLIVGKLYYAVRIHELYCIVSDEKNIQYKIHRDYLERIC